jgi:hypothetical protein
LRSAAKAEFPTIWFRFEVVNLTGSAIEPADIALLEKLADGSLETGLSQAKSGEVQSQPEADNEESIDRKGPEDQ